MGPTTSLRDICRNYYRDIKREGLNPFDLLSWDALLNLWKTLRFTARNNGFRNQKLHRQTQDMVWLALERKAESLSMDDGSDDYVEALEEARAW